MRVGIQSYPLYTLGASCLSGALCCLGTLNGCPVSKMGSEDLLGGLSHCCPPFPSGTPHVEEEYAHLGRFNGVSQTTSHKNKIYLQSYILS